MHDDQRFRRKLRKQLIKQRKAQPKQQQQEKSALIIKHLLSHARYRAAKHIAIYLPVNGEVDPTALCLKQQLPHQHFYLPVLSKLRHGEMDFVPWTQSTVFRPNQFNIPEPICPLNKTRPAKYLDLVIVPLLGFDASANRLGMGGGFYDRTFAFKLNNTHRPALIGVAYAFQKLEKVSAQAWDVPLQACVTEYGWHEKQRSKQSSE